MAEIEDVAVITAMIRYGGGFVAALGQAWLRADSENRATLKAAFPEYWERYRILATAAAGGPTDA